MMYTWNDNLSNISTEDLNTTRENNVLEYENKITNAREYLADLVKLYIPDYTIYSLYETRLTLAPKNMGRRNLTIDISFGKCLWKNDKMIFEINPATVGTFTIDTDSEERQYFATIGTILSNKEFHDKLRGTLFNLHFEVEPILETVHVINSELRKRSAEEQKAKETAMMKKEFKNNIKPFFTGDLSGCFVLVDKNTPDHLTNATYRKKPIRVVSIPGDMYKISGIKNDIEKTARRDFAIIPADKVKFTL